MRSSEKARDVIQGGCPDGFWARANCDRAAQLALCSMVTRTDNRVIATDDGVTTVTRPLLSDGGAPE